MWQVINIKKTPNQYSKGSSLHASPASLAILWKIPFAAIRFAGVSNSAMVPLSRTRTLYKKKKKMVGGERCVRKFLKRNVVPVCVTNFSNLCLAFVFLNYFHVKTRQMINIPPELLLDYKSYRAVTVSQGQEGEKKASGIETTVPESQGDKSS